MKKILVLDDDPVTGKLLSELAKMADVETILAREPLSFFQALGSHKPDGLVLDLMFPELDGFNGIQVLKSLTSDSNHLPILVLSGAQQSVIQGVGELGVKLGLNIWGVARKPVEREVFFGFLRQIVIGR